MATFSLQQKHAALDRHNAELIVQLARETEDVPLRASQQLSQLGDPAALRGAIRGTRPGASVANLAAAPLRTERPGPSRITA